MAGGKPDLDAGDSLRQWQVNSDAGTLQGWGITSGVSASPAQAATAESFQHSEVTAQNSASPTYCPVNPETEKSGAEDSDASIDPQRLQAWGAELIVLATSVAVVFRLFFVIMRPFSRCPETFKRVQTFHTCSHPWISEGVQWSHEISAWDLRPSFSSQALHCFMDFAIKSWGQSKGRQQHCSCQRSVPKCREAETRWAETWKTRTVLRFNPSLSLCLLLICCACCGSISKF